MSPNSKAFMLVLFLGVLASQEVSGFGKGAPDSEEICKTLTPKHKDKVPQTTAFPYTLKVDKTNVTAEEIVTLTISGEEFKGLLVQGRKLINYETDTDPIGTFQVDDQGKETHQGIKCRGIENSSVTHINNTPKSLVSVKWIAPKEKGDYVLLTTVVKDGYTFWVRQPSGTITVE